MKNLLHFEPLTTAKFQTYITIGTKAYNQHYTHLWEDGNSTPYIKRSFTPAVLQQEEQDENTRLFLINLKKECVGILKFTLHCPLEPYTKKDALYIDKIYITKEASGLGIGTKTLNFVSLRAKELHKKILWLEAMQKGPALNFYKKNGFAIHGITKIQWENAIPEEKPMYVLTKDISHLNDNKLI